MHGIISTGMMHPFQQHAAINFSVETTMWKLFNFSVFHLLAFVTRLSHIGVIVSWQRVFHILPQHQSLCIMAKNMLGNIPTSVCLHGVKGVVIRAKGEIYEEVRGSEVKEDSFHFN